MLRELRIERGYTLEEAAKLLGYKSKSKSKSKSGYWALEQKKVRLTVDKIEKLSKLYGVEKEIFLK